MILEGRVCGLPLIFSLSLLIPQSLLQIYKQSRVEGEQRRWRECVRKKELPTSIKKTRERWMKESWCLEAQKKKSNWVFSLGCTFRRRQWTVDRPPISQLALKPWLNKRAEFGRRRRPSLTDFLREANTACPSGLSVHLLAASINPVPHPITDREIISDHGCQSYFKASSPSGNRGKEMSVSRGKKRRSLVRISVSTTSKTACLCLSARTSSLWSTTSFDMTVSSGQASTSDSCGHDGLWAQVYFGGYEKAWWVKGSKPMCVCTWGARQQLRKPGNDSCEGLFDTASKFIYGRLNEYTMRPLNHLPRRKYSLVKFPRSILQQKWYTNGTIRTKGYYQQCLKKSRFKIWNTYSLFSPAGRRLAK